MAEKKREIRHVNTVPVNVTLYKDQHEIIDELGAQWRTSRSATIRRIFEEWRVQRATQYQRAGR